MKKTHTRTAIIFVLLVCVGTALYYYRAQYYAPVETTQESTIGNYGYRCGDGTEFTMVVYDGMQTIRLIPATSVEHIADTVLTEVPADSGARYEGGGLTFVAHGETVELSSNTVNTTCSPIQIPDEAPFNFGD